jgi:hypothetical protein
MTQPAPSVWQYGRKENSGNVHTFRFDLPRVGSEQWVLLQSDVHWDNPHCKRDLLIEHLEKAKERNAPIMDAGDFFCAMQGKYDPRGSYSDLRPEHAKGNYFDALVATGAEFLKPYAHLLTLRAWGNHETAILKRQQTDLTERLTERLKAMGSPAQTGQFSGFVRFHIKHAHTRHKSFDLYYHHGYGGGGPVTRGVIQTNRMAAFVDTDLVWSGHTHDAWQMPIQRVRLNQACNVEQFRQLHLRTAGYKDEYEDGGKGWHIERGAPPKPVGGAWLRFFVHADNDVRVEATEAL